MLMKSNLEISEGGGWFASGDGMALCYKQRRRGCSLPKKAMVTPSQITKPSRETVMEMSSEKMRWKATIPPSNRLRRRFHHQILLHYRKLPVRLPRSPLYHRDVSVGGVNGRYDGNSRATTLREACSTGSIAEIPPHKSPLKTPMPMSLPATLMATPPSMVIGKQKLNKAHA
ncbi:hypothetical protein LWI28_006028 [Acer negundo]|uniref:Uncharacterized protein n=1 Tax=Acer negundo TaxID=4023 RepID=A0AAD5IXN4_ACENE|nr:hypothetical protein LWI28_006028 [Acer negundo]